MLNSYHNLTITLLSCRGWSLLKHTLMKPYWEINSTFFTFYDDGEKNGGGGQITRVCVRMCFVSVYSLRMVCVCVYLLFFCHNDRSVWDTTGLCFMITSLHTICLMSCHHLCWKAPMARWCEYINTHFRGGKKPNQIRNKRLLLTYVGSSVFSKAEVEKNHSSKQSYPQSLSHTDSYM